MAERVTPVTPLLPILVAALSTVLAGFAFLTLPSSSDALRDLDMVSRVEIVLAAGGAVQQVTQLTGGQLGNLLRESISQ